MAVVGSGVAGAAEDVAAQQELVNVQASDKVAAAAWKRLPDSYTLQVVIDRSKFTAVRPAAPAQEPASSNAAPTLPSGERYNPYFIGNTIANLRGIDPWIPCGRTLTLIDGRRRLGQPAAAPAPAPAPVNPNIPPAPREGRVEVWLLKADGTHIRPESYTCVDGSRTSPGRTDITISYGYPVADSAAAVAVAIRIANEFHIEKLQPLAAAPAVPQGRNPLTGTSLPARD